MSTKALQRKSRLRSRENLWGYLFTAPWLIGFAAFFAFPLGYSIVLAFSRITDLATFNAEWNSINNFYDAFFKDVEFLPKLGTSLRDMIIRTPVVVIFSLFVAILLNRKLRLRGLFRTAFFLPVLIGTGIVLSTINGSIAATGAADAAGQAAVSESAQSSGMGSENSMLIMLLGYQLASYLEVILSTVTDVLWMSGIQIVIFLGALQTIPSSYYEAAFCDGASEWEKFWKITLPLIMPNILLNTVYTMIDFIGSAENEVVMYCQKALGTSGNYGFSSALSWIYFLACGILILIVFLVLRRFTYYADE